MKTEKIARMVGKTTYKDFRDGFSGATLQDDSDAEIKMALGMAQRQAGVLAVQVLETRYASTLMHERVIRRARDRHLNDSAKRLGVKRDQHTTAKQRLACALAIRKLAGARVMGLEVTEYAWMLCSRREDLDDHMRSAETWLNDLCTTASDAFLTALEVIAPRRSRIRSTKAA